MSEPFIAEIRIFAGNFAPRSWAFCDGQLLPVSQNTALFSLIGTTYGGDGRTTTALPNLQGRAPMHPGRGPGLTARTLGQNTGVETVLLNANQIPSHNHVLNVCEETGDSNIPEGNSFAKSAIPIASVYSNQPPDKTGGTAGNAGGGQSHNNMQPYLSLNYIIALQGLYPSRS
ncbi:MAG TPA: tail fiber protein [Prolixibacteraceae bacterium]|nr:tail fiber protein [Prolixibacteraceae bacterium]